MKLLSNLQRRVELVSALIPIFLFLSGSAAPAQTGCTTPPAGLVGWWRGEGDAQDSEGSNNGVFSAPEYAAGEVGQCFSFNPTGNSVRVPAAPSLDVGTGPGLTIEAWINSTDNTYGRPILEWVSKTVGGYGVHFFAHHPAPGALYASVFDTDNNHHMIQSGPGLLLTNVFQHVAVTYDKASGIGRLFIDGALVQESQLGVFTPQTSPDISIGYRPNTVPFGPIPFLGRIDEASVYNRALLPAEIQSIFTVKGAGKCFTPSPPVFALQPTNQAVFAGGAATFFTIIGGTSPLSYQWLFNGTNLPGATTVTLQLPNVQFSQAGDYVLVVTNDFGSAMSSNATLTVNPPPPCIEPPLGLVSWWPGNTNATDIVGGNNGNSVNGSAVAAGQVGQCFAFDGISSKIDLGDPPSLAFTNSFSIECWIWVNGLPPAWQGHGQILYRGDPGYCLDPYYFCVRVSGNLRFHLEDAESSIPCGMDLETGPVAQHQWQHVAATFDGQTGTMQVYTNGQLAAQTNTSIRPFQTLFGGGTSIGNLSVGQNGQSFNGLIDELAVYDRALAAAEIQSIYNAGAGGKCSGLIPPSIISEPADQTAEVGANVSFAVIAGGSVPLTYQWQFEGGLIPGATSNVLTLNSVSLKSAGSYSVVVTNDVGSATSRVALLTVTLPPASVQVGPAGVDWDGTVTVLLNLVANGNENALGFTLNFDPMLLTNTGITLGPDASSASLLVNQSQASAGKLGAALALAAGATFVAGTQQIVVVTFASPIVTSATSTTVNFGDSPIPPQLVDVTGHSLPETFSSGSVVLPVTPVEGDVYPRPDGDEKLTVSDWVLVGRYVARLDSPTNSVEFQKADCAPRPTLGDGSLTVSDWVQAGRYAAGLDPLTRVGGPTVEAPNALVLARSGGLKTESSTRQIRVTGLSLVPGQVGSVKVELEAQGDENAISFSLGFDTAKLVFVNASLADTAIGAILNVNTRQAAQGKVGCALALPANQQFAAGSKNVVNMSFRAAAMTGGNTAVSFADQPIPRGISDPNTMPLAAEYVDGSIMVNLLPALSVTRSSTGISLSWPASAVGFVLQQSSDPTRGWSTLDTGPAIEKMENVVSVRTSQTRQFYRLYHP